MGLENWMNMAFSKIYTPQCEDPGRMAIPDVEVVLVQTVENVNQVYFFFKLVVSKLANLCLI